MLSLFCNFYFQDWFDFTAVPGHTSLETGTIFTVYTLWWLLCEVPNQHYLHPTLFIPPAPTRLMDHFLLSSVLCVTITGLCLRENKLFRVGISLTWSVTQTLATPRAVSVCQFNVKIKSPAPCDLFSEEATAPESLSPSPELGRWTDARSAQTKDEQDLSSAPTRSLCSSFKLSISLLRSALEKTPVSHVAHSHPSEK